VTIGDDLPGELGKRLDPAALEKPGRRHVAVAEHPEDPFRDARRVRPVGMLGVEGQRDAEGPALERLGHRSSLPYFSTPVITIPRVKNRWKIRKSTIGMTIVISVPAWMSPGLAAIRAPLKLASPTGSVTRSGFVDR